MWMSQHEVTKIQPLLDENGHVAEPGWAKDLVWQYDRSAIKVPKYRIKEWDYYLIANNHFGVAFTISDLAYLGMISVSVLDFDKKEHHTETVLSAAPMGKFRLGSHSNQGDADLKISGFT